MYNQQQQWATSRKRQLATFSDKTAAQNMAHLQTALSMAQATETEANTYYKDVVISAIKRSAHSHTALSKEVLRAYGARNLTADMTKLFYKAAEGPMKKLRKKLVTDIQTELGNNTNAIKLAQEKHSKALGGFRGMDIPATWGTRPQSAAKPA